ncbi:hypothetical protein H2198_010029 [Neophaeococcomyces mojaviensis]|uniref:Uncharacterized protein n=1 Tax=Neophaeococcomyces mojaviensis TaxID=3383035 RepID=A0ACC2ZSQ9_9EURO|nr:hypothetical protein H2198_010029 [Knufia sp. JES_112]
MTLHEATFTLRKPPYTYFHLRVTSYVPSSVSGRPQTVTEVLDEITLRAHLTAALNQYLGLTGAAIPIDILKVEGPRNEGWIRLPAEDESAVAAALAQWTGKGGVTVRIASRGSWLGGVIGNGDGVSDTRLWSLEP